VDATVWAALVVAMSAVLTGPFATGVVAYVTYRIRSREKSEDNARQDILALRTTEVARLLKENTHSTNSKLDELDRTSKIIHTLVNSTLTKSMTSEYDATKRMYAMMLELIEIKQIQGLEPTTDSLVVVEATKIRLAELSIQLADRSKDQIMVDEAVRAGG